MENGLRFVLKEEDGHLEHFIKWKEPTSTSSNMHHWALKTIKKFWSSSFEL